MRTIISLSEGLLQREWTS